MKKQQQEQNIQKNATLSFKLITGKGQEQEPHTKICKLPQTKLNP